MAGKGGGAWKVAYADFVTAMMAFFLVMWIVAQDQKIKEAIAHYFIDPMGYFPMGQRHPKSSGGLFESKTAGNVPHSEAVAMGKGRATHSDEHGDGAVTKMVSDWLHGDPELYATWKGHADRIRTAAEHSRSPETRYADIEAQAVARLAQLLSSEMHQNMPIKQQGMYRDLMLQALSEVDWHELAEDLINE